jgi:hypothetical protein
MTWPSSIALLEMPAPNGYGSVKKTGREAPASRIVCRRRPGTPHHAMADIRLEWSYINRGGAVALPKFAVPKVCWQGYFLDSEGNTFGIFQPDASAA